MGPGHRRTRSVDELRSTIAAWEIGQDPTYFFTPREWDRMSAEPELLEALAEASRTQEAQWRAMRLHVEALREDAFATCETCSTRFTGRKDARYCSPGCRQKAYRERNAQ